MQDDSRELSRWFASRIDARRCVRVRVKEIQMDEKYYIVVQKVSVQKDADGNSFDKARVTAFRASTPLSKVIEWSKNGNYLARSDVTIVEQESEL